MNFQYSVYCVPYQGEPQAGDGHFVRRLDNGLLVVIIDVLGHGNKAAELARRMEAKLENIATNDIEWLVKTMHDELIGSLGAAMTAVYFDSKTQQATGIGIGNTLVRQLGNQYRSFSAQAGIVGELLPTLRPFSFEFQADETYLFTTDGVKENIDPDEMMFANSKALDYLSSYFVNNYSKPYDDSTAIVVRFCYE
jgi:hypothetical protein